jgi:hypothetical protein
MTVELSSAHTCKANVPDVSRVKVKDKSKISLLVFKFWKVAPLYPLSVFEIHSASELPGMLCIHEGSGLVATLTPGVALIGLPLLSTSVVRLMPAVELKTHCPPGIVLQSSAHVKPGTDRQSIVRQKLM